MAIVMHRVDDSFSFSFPTVAFSACLQVVLFKLLSLKLVLSKFQAPIELTKRLEEVRLLESRRSPRLADQDKDTDFARLADMAGDRRRQSHNIDVPFSLTQQNG